MIISEQSDRKILFPGPGFPVAGCQTDLGAKLAFLQSQTPAGAETPPDVDDPEPAGAELRQTLPVCLLALLRHPGLAWAGLDCVVSTDQLS